MKRYENVEHALCRELDKLDRKFGSSDTDMTEKELETVRLLYSSLMKAETLYQMQEDAEMSNGEMDGSGDGMVSRRGDPGRVGSGRSYRRGRDSMGRYTSRDMGPMYPDGYSGHYPEWMPPYYGRY